MPFFTMAAATPRTASSDTSQANLFQLFQPIGGVRARPLSIAGRVVAKKTTYPKIANTRRFMRTTCLRWRVRPRSRPTPHIVTDCASVLVQLHGHFGLLADRIRDFSESQGHPVPHAAGHLHIFANYLGLLRSCRESSITADVGDEGSTEGFHAVCKTHIRDDALRPAEPRRGQHTHR